MGKKKKTYEGTSVRVSDDSYAIVRDYCKANGLLVGKFFEAGALALIEIKKGKSKQ